ncbi:unnamed protein product [Rangifer tarandus platyrhynchus]|uniref:Uncharacterized protein n=2 Tax=Rangifer tarandus platyrhynchus TaxID=3082113 RepID=A0ABN8ZKF0_RANTA|nr:unnamed protein product [Rangifer tarandus platyrhynchus]CAI9706330.1 unnamed protein product [Rangifer tarandus platyrhynchus]
MLAELWFQRAPDSWRRTSTRSQPSASLFWLWWRGEAAPPADLLFVPSGRAAGLTCPTKESAGSSGGGGPALACAPGVGRPAPRRGHGVNVGPTPSTGARQQFSGRHQRPRGCGPRQARVPLGPARRAPNAQGAEKEFALFLKFWGKGSVRPGRWPNEAHGLGGRQRPKSWSRKGAGGLRRRHSPHCRRAPAPYPARQRVAAARELYED